MTTTRWPAPTTSGWSSTTSLPVPSWPTSTRCTAPPWSRPRGRPGTHRPEADGIVTGQRDLVLAVRAADCVPVLFADPDAGQIGAAHCGRPGLAAGIIPRTVEVMRQQGADRITAWIGPHVCGGCYEVPAEMQDDVAAVVPEARATTTWGTPSLDLGAGVRAQLTAAGVTRRRRLTVHPRVAGPLLLPPRRPPRPGGSPGWSYADERPPTGDRGGPGRRP